MRREPYKRKIGVMLVPHLWIGAALWPFLLYLGLSDLTEFYFYLSLFFIGSTAFCIHQGWNAYKHSEYSDFAVLAVVPILLPMLLFAWYLMRN